MLERIKNLREVDAHFQKMHFFGVTEVTQVTSSESLDISGLPGVTSKSPEVTQPISHDKAGASPCPEQEADWQQLAASGKTDFDVDDLDQALFLFAFHHVRSCPDPDFEAICRLNVPLWRERIPAEAWPIVKRQIAQRCKQLGLSGQKGSPAEQQMRMGQKASESVDA